MMMFILLFFNLGHGAGHSCISVFELEPVHVPKQLAAPINKLNPELLSLEMNLEELYLRLRAEEKIYLENSNSLLPEQLQRLRDNYTKQFQLPESEHALKIFYTNSLNALYSRVAWAWSMKQVEVIIGESIPGRLEPVVQSVMESFFLPMRFTGDLFGAEMVQTFFAQKYWLNYPWKDALVIATRFQETDQGFYHFHQWYESQKDLPPMSFADRERLMMAFSKKTTEVLCCMSSSACLACPHNRKWSREKPAKL